MNSGKRPARRRVRELTRGAIQQKVKNEFARKRRRREAAANE